jgi:hypothetical protein
MKSWRGCREGERMREEVSEKMQRRGDKLTRRAEEKLEKKSWREWKIESGRVGGLQI